MFGASLAPTMPEKSTDKDTQEVKYVDEVAYQDYEDYK